MNRAGKITLLICSSLLLASAALNVILYRKALSLYRREALLRLDPTAEHRLSRLHPAAPLLPGTRRVVYLGDDHIEGWSPLPSDSSWQTINRGREGETTAQLVLRYERSVEGLFPDVLVLEGGINDLEYLGAFPTLTDHIIEECRKNLELLVRRAKAQGCRVVLLTILPVGPIRLTQRPIWSDQTLDARIEVNQALRALAGDGVLVVDADAILADSEGRLRAEFAAGAFALNRAGYDALAAAIAPVLREAVSRNSTAGSP